jgi:hypothetical protein
MAVRRTRWLVSALIAAGALVVAGEALSAYIAGRLVVGVVAVFVLVGVLAVGFVSLARARRFIDGELRALRTDPPTGTLYAERRRQALELRRRNVVPDLEILGEATAAEEAERGYTGKYLVATTVLIGLVGTFGGLMETLARVVPVLKGDLSGAGPTGALGLIAGPLAGLHVTFGTSVVAIMVTLALALIQGDVTLHHERLLALLQERTRHVLLPELWPAEESAPERTARAVADLRGSIADVLSLNADTNAAKIAAAVRTEVQRLVDQVGADMRGAAQAQAGTLERAATTAADNLRQVTDGTAENLRQVTGAAGDNLRQVTEAAVAALAELRGTLGAQLEGASQALTAAAGDLHGSVRTLTPALAELAPQLGALSAEVALLASRADSPDEPNAVLDELVRLSEDVERLVAASQAGGAAHAGIAALAAEEPSA